MEIVKVFNRKALIISGLIIVTLIVLATAVFAYADTETEPKIETDLIDCFEDNDILLRGYFEQLLFSDKDWEETDNFMSLFDYDFNRGNLNTLEQAVYDSAKEMIINVAAGKKVSTDIWFNLKSQLTEDFGWQEYWTAEDLGVDSIYDEGINDISDEAYNALKDILNEYYDCLKVIRALFRDCPYELFWANNRYYYASPISGAVLEMREGEYQIRTNYYMTYIGLVPISKYADESTETEFDIIPESVACAKLAAARARSISAIAEDFSDYDKLKYYKDKLCELNTYNSEAASPSYTNGYGDPWQVIYMFDGDITTNVVCEGYAKSFQYLCELSNFVSPEIICYTVTGDLYQNSSNLGGHMWNLIHMDDGNNYIVDVTNCDGNNPVNTYFIVPYTSISASAGYSIGALTYFYHQDTLNLFTAEQLTVNGTSYQKSVNIGLLGERCVAHSLTLDESIGLNYYFDLPAELVSDVGAKVVFYKDGAVLAEKDVADAELVEENGFSGYKFSCDIVTKEMSDTVSAVIMDSLGNHSVAYEYSAKRYCERMLAIYEPDDSSAALVTLVKALMNYGAAAQRYFEYHTDSLANESLIDNDKVVPEIEKNTLSGYEITKGYEIGYSAKDIYLCGVSLDLLADLSMKLYFSIPEDRQIENYVFTLNDNADNSFAIDTGANSYGPYARITNIYSIDIDAQYIVDIYYDGKQIGWVKASPFAYINSSIEKADLSNELRTLLNAMHYYNLVADVYFN